MRTELFGALLSYCSSQNTNNFRIFCWFGPQMAMRIEFAAHIMKQIWICGFFSCSGRVSIYAANIRCENKLAGCKYENFVWSASPNCKQIAYSFCWREWKWKIRFSMANSTFKMKMDINRHDPRPVPNNRENFNSPNFSLPTTFKTCFPVQICVLLL